MLLVHVAFDDLPKRIFCRLGERRRRAFDDGREPLNDLRLDRIGDVVAHLLHVAVDQVRKVTER
jgi:hypothetical protein